MILINKKYDKIEYIIDLENKFRNNSYNGINNKNNNFKVINGNLPILLSAPHAVNQYRNGNLKGADILTGAITEYLCEITGVNGIIRTYNSKDDPNYENVGKSLKYKESILRIIKEKEISLFIDIHGCKDNHGFDIELGTNYGININQKEIYLNILKHRFSEIGTVAIDNKFKASGSATLSNYINKNSRIQCIQVEISSRLRRDRQRIIELLDIFQEIIKEIRRIDKNDEISR